MEKKNVIIMGGGTVSHVKNHLALSAPAYGQTARKLQELANTRFKDMNVDLQLTKMAGGSLGETNDDVESFINKIVSLASTKIVFMNVALCDFHIDGLNNSDGKYAGRYSSSSEVTLPKLIPNKKLLPMIRKQRKDIFLVAFKTTCGATEDEQYIAALNLLKANSCNLVLANDTKTRLNMIVTPEEARYCVTNDRERALTELVDMSWMRSHLTFTRSTVVDGEPVAWNDERVPSSLRTIVNHCVKRNAYKPFRGSTVGHFAVKLSDNTFLTSIRKSNFNDIEKNGLVFVTTDGPDNVIAYGARPSVGGQSQRIVFSEHAGFDCIVHFHCPIKKNSKVPIVSQKEYECGSHECGANTSRGLKSFGDIKAVYLDEHGPNIVFNKNIDPDIVIEFIENNFELEQKTGGYVALKDSSYLTS